MYFMAIQAGKGQAQPTDKSPAGTSWSGDEGAARYTWASASQPSQLILKNV